jgi:anti-sigma factor RsiW
MTDIACISGVELLMEYMEGTLAPEVRAALDAHVAGCERCVAFIESYQQTPRILRETTAREMPADLQESLLAALRARRSRERDD